MLGKIQKGVGLLALISISGLIFLDLGQFEGPILSILSFSTAFSVAAFLGLVIYRQKMSAYVTKRLLGAAFTVLVIASVTFLLLRYLPGGPFDTDKVLPAAVMENLKTKYNMDKPVYEQYFIYISNLFKGDLGTSYKYLDRDITTIIAESFPNSFKLGFYALLISFFIGIPLGVFAAAKHNTFADNFAMLMAMSGVAVPSFLVAPILIIIFAFYLQWLPPALWDSPLYYILPVITLGVRPAAIIARLTRSSVLDVISADYVRTARAKGVKERVILYKHVLRNSLIPVLTMSGPLVANVLSGSFVIEIIFAVPGMGKHFVQSVTNRDYPLILGLTLLYSVMLITANLLVDILYAVVDPRIKLA